MKFKLGKRQKRIFVLIGISSTTFYYMNLLINKGGNFSDGFLAGVLAGLTFGLSIIIFYTWVEMVYLNFKVRKK